ncbi:hypothetical protein EV360DRAFT_79082 [Lentinula raphanica]|nr:hypothetical protein EV360DRAFT_79082 [Lentinula raphanica]
MLLRFAVVLHPISPGPIPALHGSPTSCSIFLVLIPTDRCLEVCLRFEPILLEYICATEEEVADSWRDEAVVSDGRVDGSLSTGKEGAKERGKNGVDDGVERVGSVERVGDVERAGGVESVDNDDAGGVKSVDNDDAGGVKSFDDDDDGGREEAKKWGKAAMGRSRASALDPPGKLLREGRRRASTAAASRTPLAENIRKGQQHSRGVQASDEAFRGSPETLPRRDAQSSPSN